MGAGAVDTQPFCSSHTSVCPSVDTPIALALGDMFQPRGTMSGLEVGKGRVRPHARGVFFAPIVGPAQVRALLLQQKHGSKTPKSGKVAATVVCAASGCPFTVSLRARAGGSAEITNINLQHTCGGNEHRKRELSVKLLREIVPGLDALRGQGHHGDGRQVR